MSAGAGLKTYSHKPHRTPFFTPLVSYSYNVEGVPRVGAQINFADSKPVFSREDGMAWLERNYPIGKQVTVYYDPRDPDLAVLEPGAEDLVFIWYGWLGTTAGCGLLALTRYRVARRRELKPSAARFVKR